MFDTAVPASLTAVHLALAALRHHRARASLASPFVLPSFLLVPTPWIWTVPVGLIASVCAHIIWVVICEVVAPPRAPQPAAGRTTAPAPRADAAPPPRPQPTPRPATPPPATAPTPRPATPNRFAATSVLTVLDEAADIKTFRLARPEGFEYQAGQFVPVRVSVDGKPHVRCYSLSSSPDSRGYVEISVRRQGLVSTMLHAAVRSGSQLTIGRPAGKFVYPAGDDRPLVLLAGGIGITPLLSMLRYAVSSDPTRPVTLLYSARDRRAAAFLPELGVLAERHPQVQIAVTVSEPNAPAPWRRGTIDLPMIQQYVAHPSHTIFCLCGPPPMMAAMQQFLAAVGAPPAQIRSEKFDTSAAAELLNAPAARDRAEHAPAAASPRRSSTFEVSFSASGRAAHIDGSKTLLEAAEAEGVSMPSLCRSGVCQACRTRLTAGEVDCRSTVLDSEDRSAGFILPCVSWAQSDCVLEA